MSGDKVYGYSNVLGTLSAIVAHEHFEMATEIFSGILEVLDGDTEYNFRLTEKLILARVQRLD